MISFSLEGKKAIVTGASSGLGVQFAKALAEQGADVAILARRIEKLRELEEEIKKLNVKCLPIQCDVTDENSIKNAVNEVKSTFGRIDILVNNAGVVEATSGITDHTTEKWDKVLDTDLKAVFTMTREVSPIMQEQNYGKVINIASVGGTQAGPCQISYYAAKGGVVNLTKAMAGDMAPYNVTVNCIGPGVFETEMTSGSLELEGSKVLMNRTALKRFGKEGELNGALIYFASDLSSYTTGQTIYIDGGLTSML